MPTNRKIIFANGEIYHVFNHGIEKRPTFTNRREFIRAIETLQYYRFTHPPLRFSKFLSLEKEQRMEVARRLIQSNKLVEILAFCLMPNHFHFLLKQISESGVSRFIANFTNSYTKYFNTKHNRVGPLFQGLFKAVFVESEEQLMHLSRYIHLNPASSFIIKPEELETYEWSSYPAYIHRANGQFLDKNIVLGLFLNASKYKEFVMDQVDYARKLEMIKHLTFDSP